MIGQRPTVSLLGTAVVFGSIVLAMGLGLHQEPKPKIPEEGTWTQPRVLAVQFPWYWQASDDRAKRRCLAALGPVKLRQPDLLKPFEIALIVSNSSDGVVALRDLIGSVCPGAVILTSATHTQKVTPLSVPTNRILFSTCNSQEPENLKKLLPKGSVPRLLSRDGSCRTLAVDIRTGPATEVTDIAESISKVDGIKFAQVNVVHLNLTELFFTDRTHQRELCKH